MDRAGTDGNGHRIRSQGCSDGSDAAVPEYSAEISIDLGEPVTIDLQDYLGGSSYNYCSYTKYSGTSELPPGITKDGSILSGTPTELGSYHLQFRFNNSYVSLVADAILNFDITVTPSRRSPRGSPSHTTPASAP